MGHKYELGTRAPFYFASTSPASTHRFPFIDGRASNDVHIDYLNFYGAAIGETIKFARKRMKGVVAPSWACGPTRGSNNRADEENQL